MASPGTRDWAAGSGSQLGGSVAFPAAGTRERLRHTLAGQARQGPSLSHRRVHTSKALPPEEPSFTPKMGLRLGHVPWGSALRVQAGACTGAHEAGRGRLAPESPAEPWHPQGPQQAAEEVPAGRNRHQWQSKGKGSRLRTARPPGPRGLAALVSWSPWAASTGAVHTPALRLASHRVLLARLLASWPGSSCPPRPAPSNSGAHRKGLCATNPSRPLGRAVRTDFPCSNASLPLWLAGAHTFCPSAEACAWLWRDAVTPRGQEGG